MSEPGKEGLKEENDLMNVGDGVVMEYQRRTA